MVDAHTGTHFPTPNDPGDGDDGTNKNLMINLFEVDDTTDESRYTGAQDVQISGKGPVPRNPVPYDSEQNGPPTGDDVHWSLDNSEGENNPDDIIP